MSDEDFVRKIKNEPRFVIKIEEFGSYIYDNLNADEISMDEVVVKLNEAEKLINTFDRVLTKNGTDHGYLKKQIDNF